jgi:hypothetical protein
MTDWNEENRISIVSAPSNPITTANVKTYAQIDYTTDDNLLSQLATQAREWVESYTRRKLALLRRTARHGRQHERQPELSR